MDTFIADNTLTKENAQDRGLYHIEDILITDTNWKSLQKIFYFSSFTEYIFGKPVTERKNNEGLWFGLYIPDPKLRFTFDETLNTTNAEERSMYYLYNGSFDERLDQLGITFFYVLTHGGVLGNPSVDSSGVFEKNKAQYGLYLPKALDILIVPKLFIDNTLTPETAKERRLEYKHDMTYDPKLGFHELMEFLIENWGFPEIKFGKPKEMSPRNVTGVIGVYSRI
ncbi:MAG TPA: hypothetical protein VLG12_03620 [Candidatus Saccharimonadales bacterium]|nr:hypothetical protein [Candidatus Saccharimonadales bacterium]